MQQDLLIVEVIALLRLQDLTEIIAQVILEEVLHDLVEMQDQEEPVLKDQRDQLVGHLHVQQRDLVLLDLDLLTVGHHHLEVVVFLEVEVLQDLQADQEVVVHVVEEEEDNRQLVYLFY